MRNKIKKMENKLMRKYIDKIVCYLYFLSNKNNSHKYRCLYSKNKI